MVPHLGEELEEATSSSASCTLEPEKPDILLAGVVVLRPGRKPAVGIIEVYIWTCTVFSDSLHLRIKRCSYRKFLLHRDHAWRYWSPLNTCAEVIVVLSNHSGPAGRLLWRGYCG